MSTTYYINGYNSPTVKPIIKGAYQRPSRGAHNFHTLISNITLQDGDIIEFEVDGVSFCRVFKIDTSMKGTIALNPTFDMGLSASLLSSYRFSRLVHKKTNNENIGNNDE